jgi:hypothetical protein
MAMRQVQLLDLIGRLTKFTSKEVNAQDRKL